MFGLDQHRADRAAYIDDVGTTTYSQLADRARRFATVLHTLGVHANERVLRVMVDTVKLPVAFLGALYAGATPVTFEHPAHMLTRSRARVVIASSPALTAVAQALGDTEHDGCLLVNDSRRQQKPAK